MIVVTGATGHLGRLVIASLLKTMPASKIVAVVRNVEKAKDLATKGIEVRIADYSEPTAWDVALKGADKVLLISSSEVGQRAKQHRSVVDAAIRADVRFLAYTSILHCDASILRIAAEHKETEDYLHASGLPLVLLRNSWYTENYMAGIPAALSSGTIYGCAGQGRISSAARADYAEAAAAVLTMDNQAGKVYELAGDTAYTLADLAAEISRQTGKNVKYVNLPEAGFRNALVKAGFPEAYASLLADSETGISRGALFEEGRDLSRLINRPTTTLAESVGEALRSS